MLNSRHHLALNIGKTLFMLLIKPSPRFLPCASPAPLVTPKRLLPAVKHNHHMSVIYIAVAPTLKNVGIPLLPLFRLVIR